MTKNATRLSSIFLLFCNITVRTMNGSSYKVIPTYYFIYRTPLLFCAGVIDARKAAAGMECPFANTRHTVADRDACKAPAQSE